MYQHVILVTVLPLKHGLEEIIFADLIASIEASRQFPGCLSFDLYRLTKEHNIIALQETWETQEAYESYCHSPLKSELSRLVAASLAGPIKTWQVEEIC